jgi:hypothetical protein
MADKVTETLVEALKQALAEPAEQRLYRSGKLAGLFASRSGAGGEAAARALRADLLEVVRTETRGKTVIEWVRVTPRAVDFLHDHESPIRALEGLKEALQKSKDSVPVWLTEMRQHLQALEARLTEDAQRLLHRLESLCQRAEEAIGRLDGAGPILPDSLTATVPWAREALAYLDRRRAGGAAGDCPLPELFSVLAPQYPNLSVQSFHDGLRCLQDRRSLRLLPFTGPADALAQAEYALFDGTTVLYYVAR